ncbi:MAG TPA: hypothetical protein VEV13_07400, partial [Candidatus Limnocylindria bacterium]|nr:hypothetical protein [Candidatus Limnocylindria bacterium]
VLLGVTLAAVVVQLIWHFNWIPDTDLASFDVRPLELLPIAVVGVVTGVLAAVIPARQASRLDVVAALRGRSGAGPRSRRTPVVGTVMVLVGIVLSVLGSGLVVAARNDGGVTSQNLVVGVLVGGAALVLLGLVVCAGSVVSLIARVAPRLPLAGRLALRDADRHRGRTAPAVAAILAAVSGSVAVMLYVASLDQSDQDEYTAASPPGTSTVRLTTWVTDLETGLQTATKLDPADALTAVSSAMPVDSSTVVKGIAECEGVACASVGIVRPRANQCPIYDEEPWDRGPGTSVVVPEETPNDPRCGGRGSNQFWAFPQIGVGGPEMLEASGQSVSAEAKRVLAAGGIVVTDRLYLDTDGTVRLKYYSTATSTETAPPGQEDTWAGPTPDKVVRVPGAYVPPQDAVVQAIVSPPALKGMNVEVTPQTLVVRTDGPVSEGQEDAANAALSQTLGNQVRIWVERGYESTYGLGLLALALAAGIVTLGATGIATGLALTDARADHATLAAVGAAPRVRRRLAAAQAMVVALLGVLLGIAAGVVPALSIIGAVPTLQVVWPVPQLLALVVGVPLLAGAAAYVFTRSKVPMQRRLAT